MRRPYRKRPNYFVIAVQLDLDTEGFCYRKWGHEQRCKRGDWIINNRGEVYTVDQESFASSYRELEQGRYLKTTPVWAERARSDGSISTRENATDYRQGDYLVFNSNDETDGYAMSADAFEAMYEAIDG